MRFAQRLNIAWRAAVGIFSENSLQVAHGMLRGVLPGGAGTPPVRGTADFLRAYSQMPWLRAVASRVSTSTARAEWQLFAVAGKGQRARREKYLQRAPREQRVKLLKQVKDQGELRQITDHPMLDLLHDANEVQTGLQMRKLTQLYLDLVGDAFWLKERDGQGTVVAVWPIPPHWVLNTPTPTFRFYRVGFRGWKALIPDTEFVWFCDPDPLNPYGRGSGSAMALTDELETDEYAARMTKAFFYNQARPDLIIWPKGDPMAPANVKRLEEDWLANAQGVFRSFKPYFMNREVEVRELEQNFRSLTLVPLREFERDAVMQHFGVPPEILGVLTSSNRATIDSADYFMSRYVVDPRLEFQRTILQERLVPEYDERLIVDYVSPIQEDKEFHFKVASASPWAITVDEWREMQGREPLEDKEAGQLHPINGAIFGKIEEPPEPPPGMFPGVGGVPVMGPPPPDKEDDKEAEKAARDAGDAELANYFIKAAQDDSEDLPTSSAVAATFEPALQKSLVRVWRNHAAKVGLAAFEKALEAESAESLNLEGLNKAQTDVLTTHLSRVASRGAELAFTALRRNVRSLKYSEDQARVPAGSPEGGQWTSDGGEGAGGEAPRETQGTDQGARFYTDDLRFKEIQNDRARISNAMLAYQSTPDHPEMLRLHNEMKSLSKEMHKLDTDKSGLEGVEKVPGVRDVAVIGAGPGGLATAIMTGGADLDTIVIEAQMEAGGQSKVSASITNYPGYPMGADGDKVASNNVEAAQAQGAEMRLGHRVVGIEHDPVTGFKTLTMDNGEKVVARAVVIAGGQTFKKPTEEHFTGATHENVLTVPEGSDLADRANQGNGVVVILGGSNGAAQAARGAAQRAQMVHVVTRGDFEMDGSQLRALQAHPRIRVWDHQPPASYDGKTFATKGGLKFETGAVGVYWGGSPNTKWLPPSIKLERGQVAINSELETSMPGVYAIGDIRFDSPGRIGAAVGDGQSVARNVWRYFDRAYKKNKGMFANGRVIKARGKKLPQAQWEHMVEELFALDLQHPWFSQTVESAEEKSVVVSVKYSDDQPRDDRGRWTDGGASGDSGPSDGPKWSQSTDDRGRPVPIRVATVEEAVQHVLDGKVVELPDVRSANTLIAKLAAMAQEAKASGQEAKNYDLCNVSVKGSNLFCAERVRTEEHPEGIPRIEMPQLAGEALPGTPAAELPRAPYSPNEVDTTERFMQHLEKMGVAVSLDIEPAARLKASQRELVGPKVAAMMVNEQFDPANAPLFISRDNYVIDGHHRWAAVVGRDAADNKLGDIKMRVLRIDMPITEVLHLANWWTRQFGIKPAAGPKKILDLLFAALLKYSEDQPRDDHGRWTDGAGVVSDSFARADGGKLAQTLDERSYVGSTDAVNMVDSDRENGAFVGADGTHGYVTSGERDSIRMNGDDVQKWLETPGGFSFVHTHPASGPPSFNDFAFLAKANIFAGSVKMHEMSVRGKDGSEYSIRAKEMPPQDVLESIGFNYTVNLMAEEAGSLTRTDDYAREVALKAGVNLAGKTRDEMKAAFGKNSNQLQARLRWDFRYGQDRAWKAALKGYEKYFEYRSKVVERAAPTVTFPTKTQ